MKSRVGPLCSVVLDSQDGRNEMAKKKSDNQQLKSDLPKNTPPAYRVELAR
jgi:hypothetical protein